MAKEKKKKKDNEQVEVGTNQLQGFLGSLNEALDPTRPENQDKDNGKEASSV